MLGKLRNMATVYLMKDGKFLLLYRQDGKVVNDVYTGSAGGHFEESELNDAKACVLRELEEEISVTADMISSLTLKYITLRLVNGEIRQNYYFFADLISEPASELTSNEGQLKWVTPNEALELDMPFTAKFIVEHYIKSGRYNDKVFGGVATADNVIFTEMS